MSPLSLQDGSPRIDPSQCRSRLKVELLCLEAAYSGIYNDTTIGVRVGRRRAKATSLLTFSDVPCYSLRPLENLPASGKVGTKAPAPVSRISSRPHSHLRCTPLLRGWRGWLIDNPECCGNHLGFQPHAERVSDSLSVGCKLARA